MTPSTLRTEALLAVAALLAGAAVGVLVQAAAEVGRARRADREQLQAAGAVLDEHDAELQEMSEARDAWRRDAIAAGRELGQVRDQLRAYQRAGAGVEPPIRPVELADERDASPAVDERDA